MKRISVASAAIALAATPIAAIAQSSTPVQVEQPWARASAGAAKNGVAYLILKNAGPNTDQLVAGASPVAERVEFHTHIDDDGVMRMRKVDAIDVKPGETIVFSPGGLHVMLVGLHDPLAEGQRFPLTLTFERNGDVTVDVAVQKAGAKGPQPNPGHHRDGP